MTVNFGNVASDYAKYRDRLPDVLFEQFKERGILFRDKMVIDLGSGTGIFTRDLAKEDARVVGIEPSQKLIKEAEALDLAAGINTIQYLCSAAEDFQLNARVSIATAVRAWHWFDRIKVVNNVKNHLMPDGLMIVIHSIFLPNSEVARLTFEAAREHNIEVKPAGSYAENKERRNGFPVNWFDEWEQHSFHVKDEWQHDYNLEFTHDEWCGKVRSISWMTNASDETRNHVTNALLKKLESHNKVLNVPHRFAVVVLRGS